MNQAISSTAKNTPISFVLVNYKTRQLTEASLTLLRQALDGYQAQVWVVDNDSADDSTEYLRSLGWIHLIERKWPEKEKGFEAHGRALDIVLEQVDTDYLFLLHTDTLIYDPAIFDLMLEKCLGNKKIAAVGCLEQINRGFLRSFWRLISRFCSHHFRRLKLSLGLKSKEPSPYRETHLKSFCALWNSKILKAHSMNFFMADKIPGYEAQDRLSSMGYKFATLSPGKIFRYLDHVEAGTVSAIGGYDPSHRRAKKYHAILDKLGRN